MAKIQHGVKPDIFKKAANKSKIQYGVKPDIFKITTNFIKKPSSSKTNFFKKQLHPCRHNQIESWDRTKHDWDGENKKVRISVKASRAENL